MMQTPGARRNHSLHFGWWFLSVVPGWSIWRSLIVPVDPNFDGW
jgi:hypothetical protein